MRFVQAVVVCALTLAAISSLMPAAPALAQQDPAASCVGMALEDRKDALGIGGDIGYGDSLQEVALYRLLTGIDQAPLKSEFQTLQWGGPDGIYDTDAPAATFADLLIPAADLEADPARYVTYYRAQDMLKESGLRAYRPDRGGLENAADWWLRDDADPLYREDDFAGWLQAMAASDTFHRIKRNAGRAYYRPLISSWTYFDPKQWDVAAYDRVTALALDKWLKDGKLIWATVVFARLRTDQAEADGLIEWFYALHARVKTCAATRYETILYSFFRFHTLRLLFTRAAYGADQPSYDKAMALMADTIPDTIPGSIAGAVTSDDTAATRAALLMAGYSYRGQIFYPSSDGLLEGLVPQAQAWRDLRWASARSFDDYVKLAEGQIPESPELGILNGLSTAALYRLLEGDAFTPEIRDKLAETGWLRSYLLDQDELNQRFLIYIADHHAALKDEAKALLAAPETERAKDNLLFLLRHKNLSVQIDTDWNDHALWCNGLGVDTYRSTLADIMGPVLRMAEIPQTELWHSINYWYEYGQYDLTAASPGFTGAEPAQRWPEWLGDSYFFTASKDGKVVNYNELAQLGHLPLPRDFLIGRVLDWAKSERSSFEKLQAFFNFDGDQRVAEALHRAVLDTRNICTMGGDPHRMSRAAWVVLHANPRWQAWAEKTPYWYD